MFQKIIWLDLVPVAMRLAVPLSQCWSVLRVACTPRWDSKQSHISNKWTLAAGFNWKKNVIPYNPDHFLILNYFLHLCMFQNNLTFWLQIYMNIGDVIATHCHTVGHHYIFGETSHQPAYWNCVFPSNHMMAVVHWVLNNSALLQRYPDCPPEGLAQHSKHYTSCPLGVRGLQKW